VSTYSTPRVEVYFNNFSIENIMKIPSGSGGKGGNLNIKGGDAK